MLVYANHFGFQGTGAEEAVFKAIGAWLKEQLGFGLHPAQLREDSEYRGTGDKTGARLRIYATVEEAPELYAWVLKVTDNRVRGRQWVTELGLKVQEGNYELSCVLKTDEHSTLVDDPVMPSQPRVIRYVVGNIRESAHAEFSPGNVGISIKTVGNDVDSCRGLMVDIEKSDRSYPIVLVSPDKDDRYHVNAGHLQQLLTGLAQVVQVDIDSNSYEMADVLGNHWSAWDGAVNIIHTRTPNGFVRGRLFRSDEVDSWGETQHERISRLLAWVTNNTNVPQMRRRIRIEGVMQLALRRRLQLSRARSSEMNDIQLRQELAHVWQLADEQTAQISQLEGNIHELEDSIESLEFSKMEVEDKYKEALDDIRNKEFSVKALKEQLGRSSVSTTTAADVESLLDLMLRPGQLTPIECLSVVESLYGDKCVVLDTAKDSARRMSQFRYGQRLLGMLRLLVTEYVTKIKEGGDNLAKGVFGKNDYAANESETVISNPDMRRKRVFEYNGEKLEMFRHLRIGVDDDKTKTIRVHFHWDSAREIIVVGYCGEHLPVSSH